MAEFIFDLQLFADDPEDITEDTTEDTDTVDESGGNDGSSSGEGNDSDNSDSSSNSDSSDNSSSSTSGNVYVEESDETTGRNITNVKDPYSGYNSQNFSRSGWERSRNEGEIIFPMFMSNATANAFAEYSYDVFVTALNQDAVPVYDIQDGIVDSVDYSRFLGSAIVNNDTYDVINLVDSNVGNLIEYYTYNSGEMLSLIFDTGAVLVFDIDQVSPWFNFANGESMVYSAREGQWLSGDEATAEFTFWNTAIPQYGTNATDTSDNVDNFYVTQGTNTAIYDAEGYDNIWLYDVTSSDVSYSINAADYTINLDSTEVTDSYITVYFPTGGALVVENSSNYSPIFNLADGTSYYYNRNRDEWRGATWDTIAALKASDAEVDAYNQAIADAYAKAVREQALYESGYDVVVEADELDANGNKIYSSFPLSIVNNNYVYDVAYNQPVYFYDAVFANLVDYSADGAYLTFDFNNGTTSTVEFDYNFSPIIAFADGTQIAYDYYSQTWGTPYYLNSLGEDNLMLSRGADSIIYQAGSEDTIYFADAVAGNISNVSTSSWYINIFFDTGAVTNVRYTDSTTPDFVFADGTRYYYSLNTDSWTSYLSSADTASDDLWGDTFSGTAAADEIFVGTVGNTLVQNVDAQDSVTFDATLSDIVATSVSDNTIAIAFGTGATAVIETAGTSPTFNLTSGESYIYDKQSASWKTA